MRTHKQEAENIVSWSVKLRRRGTLATTFMNSLAMKSLRPDYMHPGWKLEIRTRIR